MLDRLFRAVAEARAPELAVDGVFFGRYQSAADLCRAVEELAVLFPTKLFVVTGVLHEPGYRFGRYTLASFPGAAVALGSKLIGEA